MEQSRLGSTTSESENMNSGANERKAEQEKSADQQLVADQLMAALASGNLDHLAQAREAFLKKSPAEPKAARQTTISSEPPAPVSDRVADLELSLERRATPRGAEHQFVAVDQLRQEEEELERVEAELDRRRAEVAAAKKKAEDEAKRRAFEETKS